MQSIFFPPLLSLEDCPDNNKEGATSIMTTPMRKDESNKQDSSPKDFFPSWSQEDLDMVHDCGVTLSEGRDLRRRRHPLPTYENTAGCLHQSQSMPSFEHITLQMSESNNNVAGADTIHTDHHDDAPASAAAAGMDGGALHHDVPFPTCIPKLRIRRITSEIDLKLMPSPLARRGGKEVEYLQKQLKAEAMIRRKQELHNEQRKMRKQSRDEGGNNNDCIGISTLIEEDGTKNNKFSYAQKPHRRRHSRSSNKSIDNNNCNFMDLAASPPAILKNFSFKRSVSEALNDSGLPPEDANLLFTPMGRPLDEENDVAAASNSEEVFTMDEDVSVAASSDDETEEATGDAADDDDNDDEDDVELPPSLVVPSEAHNQLGGSPHDRNSPTLFKKITLRPKMKVRADSTDFSSPMGTYAYKSTDQNKVSTSGGNEQRIVQDTKADKADNSTALNKWKYVSPQKSRHGRLASQRFLSSASESFDALTLEDNEAFTNESMHSRTRMNSAESDLSDRGISPSFSESNYATPDNSYSGRQSVRARKWSMSQLPNLPLASSPYHEMDFSTPGSAHGERIGLPTQLLPTAPLFCSSIDEEAVTPSLPSMEQPSFNTPHHSFAPNRASRGNHLLSIPQFAELVVPQLVSPTKPTAENIVPSSGEEKKEESDEDEPQELDLESQFAVFSKTPIDFSH